MCDLTGVYKAWWRASALYQLSPRCPSRLRRAGGTGAGGGRSRQPVSRDLGDGRRSPDPGVWARLCAPRLGDVGGPGRADGLLLRAERV